MKIKGISDESINLLLISDNILNPVINYFGNAKKRRIKFDENRLKQEKVTFTHKQVVIIYIVYEINFWPFVVGQYFTLGDSLFGAVKFTANADPGRYKYFGYGFGFGVSGSF